MLFSIATAVDTAPWSFSAPPRVEVVSGLVGQDNFVPSRRFREDGLEDLKLSTGGARDTPGAPAVAKRRKPINNVHPKPNETMQILEAMSHALCFTYFFLPDFFMDRTPLEAGVFTWF